MYVLTHICVMNVHISTYVHVWGWGLGVYCEAVHLSPLIPIQIASPSTAKILLECVRVVSSTRCWDLLCYRCVVTPVCMHVCVCVCVCVCVPAWIDDHGVCKCCCEGGQWV